MKKKEMNEIITSTRIINIILTYKNVYNG